MATTPEEMEEMEEMEHFAPKESFVSKKINFPVLENFSTPFKILIEKDIENGLKYYYRESEISIILKSLIKKDKQHIAIIGENGTGRETLLKTVAQKVHNGDTTMILDKHLFFNLDLDSLISGTKYRGQFEERVKAINTEIERSENIVLYIKNLDRFTEISSLTVLLRSKAKIITTLTSETADIFFKKDSSFYNLFNILRISPTNPLETSEILKNHISRFHKLYSVNISEACINNLLELSNLYLPEELQPQKSISVMEEVCASIEINRLSDPNDILHEYKIEFDDKRLELQETSQKKNEIVKNQQFEEAAKLRDLEKKLEYEIEYLKSKIDLKSKESRVSVSEDHLIEGIHYQTGINKDKIKKREKIILTGKQGIRTEYSGLPQFEFLQTQSILHGHQISIKSGLAFVLIPHNKEFDDLFYHYIKPSVEHHGLTALKADNIFKPGNILSQVWAQIRTAEVLIVDVSGQNSNVIFELGLCYGIQRCPILLTRDPSELPFNIRNLRYIQYDNTASGAHKLSEDIKIAIEEFLSAVRTDIY